MQVTIVSAETLEGLLGAIAERQREGWRLYGAVFVVSKSMCKELPEGVDEKGKRVCLMMVRNVGDGI